MGMGRGCLCSWVCPVKAGSGQTPEHDVESVFPGRNRNQHYLLHRASNYRAIRLGRPNGELALRRNFQGRAQTSCAGAAQSLPPAAPARSWSQSRDRFCQTGSHSQHNPLAPTIDGCGRLLPIGLDGTSFSTSHFLSARGSAVTCTTRADHSPDASRALASAKSQKSSSSLAHQWPHSRS
jgi:hypothetical protein